MSTEADLVKEKLLQFELQGSIPQDQKALLASTISSLLNEAARERDALKVLQIQQMAFRLEKIKATISSLVDQAKTKSARIFIVHGRDKKMKNAVIRAIKRAGLEPITLEAMPNRGKFIGEKLEDYSKGVDYAVILLSPDDKGYLKEDGSKKARPRARQNVILELGFFWGRIGREHVVALYPVEGIKFEPPSDYEGVAHIPYDETKNWKLSLLNELGADVNKLLKRN
jgi:predicted nucleotide-binding protein